MRQRKAQSTEQTQESSAAPRNSSAQSQERIFGVNSSWFGLLTAGIDTIIRMLKWVLTFLLGKEQVKSISGPTSANEFKAFFDSTYGTMHPTFFIGSYSQLLEKGKRESKWILVAFYAPDHPGNTDFCKEIIASSHLKTFLSRKKCLFWVGDLRTEEGIKGIFSFFNKE